MRRSIAGGLIVSGAILLAWAVTSDPRSSADAPYELRISPAPSDALPELVALGAESAKLERLEIGAPGVRDPIATAILTRGNDGGRTLLEWRNAVTEPVFFADAAPAELAKVMTAIREHVPSDAVVLSWWDMSRQIRLLAQRLAPLDDPLARGLLAPAAWSANTEVESERQQSFWGAGVASGDARTFAKFIDALLFDEAGGAQALVELSGGKTAYVAVRLSDIWKAAAARPDRLLVAYRDFPSAGQPHGVMKAARQWMEEQRIEGGYAIEPMATTIRLHYLPRKSDADRLIARLLPFSTSNPLRLERLRLVYQHQGYWIYKLNEKTR